MMSYNVEPIEKYFAENGYPDFDITIRQGERVTKDNAKTFVEGNISVLRAHDNTTLYLSHFDRLKTYYKKCKTARSILKQ